MASVLFILSGLVLAVGVILYISAINDEMSHRPRPKPGGKPEHQVFLYDYGWSFYFAGLAFAFTEATAIICILVYLRRYDHIDDMINMVPGLYRKVEKQKKGAVNASCDTSVDAAPTTHAATPTIIF